MCFHPRSLPSDLYLHVGFELVDVSELLPTLIRRPGLTKWLPTIGRDIQFFETYENYLASLPGGKGTARLARGHWPPAEELGLDRWYVPLDVFFGCFGPSWKAVYAYIRTSRTRGVFSLLYCNTDNQRRRQGSVTFPPDSPCLLPSTREGKRTADEVAEIPEVKKARLESDVDVLMAPTTELPTATDPEPSDPPTAAAGPATQAQKQKLEETGTGDYVFKEMPYTFVSPSDPIVESCKQVLSLLFVMGRRAQLR